MYVEPDTIHEKKNKNKVNVVDLTAWVQIGSNVQETVAALLETTKHLQDCLRRWSIGKVSDELVSDVYVDVGTKFNATVTAFMSIGIDLS